MRTAVHTSPSTQTIAVGSLVICPEDGCGRPADVLAAWSWESTSGPMAHARTHCPARHVLTVPVAWIAPLA